MKNSRAIQDYHYYGVTLPSNLVSRVLDNRLKGVGCLFIYNVRPYRLTVSLFPFVENLLLLSNRETRGLKAPRCFKQTLESILNTAFDKNLFILPLIDTYISAGFYLRVAQPHHLTKLNPLRLKRVNCDHPSLIYRPIPKLPQNKKYPNQTYSHESHFTHRFTLRLKLITFKYEA